MSLFDQYKIKDKVVVITGGAGLIGRKHAIAVLEGEGIPVLLDIFEDSLERAKNELLESYPGATICTYVTDITSREALEKVRDDLLEKFGNIYGLINNAANNPKMEGGSKNMGAIQFHNLPLSMWQDDMAVGLTGAFLCCFYR